MIEKAMLDEVVGKVKIDKVARFKADQDGTEVKSVTIRANFEGVTLRDVFYAAMAPTVIKWQNGPGRKHFNTWKSGQVIEVHFASPGKRVLTPEEIMAKALEMLKGASPEVIEKFKSQLGE